MLWTCRRFTLSSEWGFESHFEANAGFLHSKSMALEEEDVTQHLDSEHRRSSRESLPYESWSRARDQRSWPRQSENRDSVKGKIKVAAPIVLHCASLAAYVCWVELESAHSLWVHLPGSCLKRVKIGRRRWTRGERSVSIGLIRYLKLF